MANITCIIPCYNAVGYCEEVIEETLQFCNKLILINDGSTDATGKTLKNFASKYREKITLLNFEKNRGKGFALLSGMQEALKAPFDALVTLDADKQHLPEEISQIAQSLIDGADLVIGTRNFKEMPFRSKFSNMIISKLLSCLYSKAPIDTQSGFRGFSRIFAKKIVDEISGGRYETEFRIILLALDEKKQITSIPITTVYLKQQPTYFQKISDSARILKVFFTHICRRK